MFTRSRIYIDLHVDEHTTLHRHPSWIQWTDESGWKRKGDVLGVTDALTTLIMMSAAARQYAAPICTAVL